MRGVVVLLELIALVAGLQGQRSGQEQLEVDAELLAALRDQLERA